MVVASSGVSHAPSSTCVTVLKASKTRARESSVTLDMNGANAATMRGASGAIGLSDGTEQKLPFQLV